ncbi:MAG TPA: HAMP domain-containing sensor histidine kinase [Gemmatimonadales bacterium]
MVLVFAGLFVALRSLARSERESIEADAKETAAVARTFLSVQAEALSPFHGLFLDGTRQPPADSIAFLRLVDATREHLSRFRRIWITDTAGVVLWQVQLTDGAQGEIPPRFDVDTATRLSLGARAGVARATEGVVVSSPGPLFGGDTGFVLLQPLVVDSVFHGFAGGTVSLSALRSVYSGRGEPAHRLDIVILTDSVGADTVARIGDPEPEARRDFRATGAPVTLPDSTEWWAVVRYPERSPIQLQLWVVAFAALGALVVGGWHERRQTRRMADRSRELEHLSRELIRANRVKSEFLANVSHELRTPLNAIVGFTELLRDGVYGELGPRQTGPVARIEASSQHLRQLVDQILDLAKMSAGRLEVHEERVDLRQFVLDIATEMEPLVAARGLGFSMSISASTPRVRTDPAHLRQIVLNLLGNAIKFTPQGSVTVRARPVDPPDAPAAGSDAPEALRATAPDPAARWVALQVTDTGIGIAPADQERIFGEFEQVVQGAPDDNNHRGTGLGLPISRRLAVLLGGDLTVESQPGRGSTFTVWLPVE